MLNYYRRNNTPETIDGEQCYKWDVGKHLFFYMSINNTHNGKPLYSVTNKHDGDLLGVIAYNEKWKKYSIWPKPNTVFEFDCLRDIAQFLEERTKE